MKSFATFALLAIASLATAAPVDMDGTKAATTTSDLDRRAVVAHDSLQPKAQTVSKNPNGEAIARFNPKIRIASGCEPYTAVDDAGNISGGVKPGGRNTANCADPFRGQTYARAGTVDCKFAIMYAFYMPKDQPRSGDTIGSHRHDWENIVVFLDTAKAKITAGAASGHGKYKKTTSVPLDGSAVKVEYFTKFPTNHELQFTGDTRGFTKPVLDWDAMTPAMRDGLSKADFGSASVPFKDGSFESNVRKAM